MPGRIMEMVGQVGEVGVKVVGNGEAVVVVRGGAEAGGSSVTTTGVSEFDWTKLQTGCVRSYAL